MALLTRELPGLFAGGTPAVQASATADLFELDQTSLDSQASEPRPDDRTDALPFDRTRPEGPYLLSQPPDPGPRRISLTTALGDRIPLSAAEVHVDPVDARRFMLALRADRDLSGVSGVQALYGVTAVFTRLRYGQDVSLLLQSNDPAVLDKAEAMALAVVALNHGQLIEASDEDLRQDDYSARIEIKSLRLIGGTAPTTTTRRLQFRAEVELKAARALAADEGTPIRRIRTPSAAPGPVDPNRPVDIRIDVEA